MQVISNSSIVLTPSLFALIDEAGAIHSEIARLTKQLESMKTTIKASGLGKNSGFVYQANVYEKTLSDKTDWEAIALHFEPSRQLITAHTKPVKPQVAINFEKV